MDVRRPGECEIEARHLLSGAEDQDNGGDPLGSPTQAPSGGVDGRLQSSRGDEKRSNIVMGEAQSQADSEPPGQLSSSAGARTLRRRLVLTCYTLRRTWFLKETVMLLRLAFPLVSSILHKITI